MAPRDHNLFAWQAYVIAMSFVVLMLIVALGWTIASTSNTQRQAEEANARAKASDDASRKLATEVQLLKGMLGAEQLTEADWSTLESAAPNDDSSKKLREQFKRDMSLLGSNEPAQNRNYPKLTETLMRELRDRNLQIDAASRSQAELIKKTESTIASETRAREAAEAKTDKLEKELEATRIDFKAKIDESQQVISQINETLQKSNAAAAKEKARLEAALKEKTQRAEELIGLNNSLKRRLLELEGEDFQMAQGKVVEVAEGGKVVYVNLGSSDGLRHGIKFSVIDPKEVRIKEARPKAHIEIVEILGPNLSRGTVTSGDIRSPIVYDDLVYSLVWQRGRPTKFALMGKIDINNDGQDDRQVLKNMILQGGGEISEDLSPDGKSTGKMTVDTNWLIVGESFRLAGNEAADPTQKEYQRKYSDMQQRAKELAVSQINLDKALTWLQGSRESDRVISMGSSGVGKDFRKDMRTPTSYGSVSEIYRQPKLPGAYQRTEP